MNVASLELSKELYELSRWEGDAVFRLARKHTSRWPNEDKAVVKTRDEYTHPFGEVYSSGSYDFKVLCPAYDLGYLLRKIQTAWPHITGTDYAVKLHNIVWSMEPENDAAKLAIELFKQGILKREEQSL